MKNPGLTAYRKLLSNKGCSKTVKKFSKLYKLFIVSVIFSTFISKFSFAQSAGDYRTTIVATNWSAPLSWVKFNGLAWLPSADYPGQNPCTGCTVTIGDAHSLTLDISPANSIGSLVIGSGSSGSLNLGTGSFSLIDAGNLLVNAGATLNLNTANFTVSGTTTTAGTITDASNTGINTFTGPVTKTNGTWSSTSVTTPANMVFTNGFTNTSGSFTAGAATFGAGTTILATAAMSFSNTFTGNGSLNINGAGGVTITGTNVNATIAGNLSILANASLTYSGSLSGLLGTTAGGNVSIATGATLALTSTGNFTVAGTTTIDGTFSDNNDIGTNTFTGLVTNNGIFNTDAVTTANNNRIDGGFTNNAGATFNVTSLRLSGTVTAAAAMIIDGTIQNAGGLTTFAAGTVSVIGTDNVFFPSLVINSGATLTVSTTGSMNVVGTANIAGTFTDNDNTSTTTFAGLLTVSGTFNATALNLSTLFINGGLNYTAGTFNCTAATIQSNGTTISNNAAVNFSGGVNITGGGGITFAGPAALVIGGTVNLNFPVSLTVSGNLTFANTGTVTVAATTVVSGTLVDNNNTSATTFTGAFSSTGNVDFSALSTANIIFNGGVAHMSGTFNVPTATISTNAVFNDIDVTSAIDFTGGVAFTGTGTLSVVGSGGLTFSGTSSISIPADLVLGTGSSLTLNTSGNFSVAGTTTLGGSFTDNNNTGTTTFSGLITKTNGAWLSTAVTTPSNMVFMGGVTQTGGTFIAGAASMPGGQTLNSNPGPVMIFNNPLVIGGSGDITISGLGGVTLAGTAINYAIPGNLTLTGTLLISTTGNFTVSGTTVMSGSASFTDNNNTGITSFTGLVTHNSTGAWTSTAVTTPANMVFTAGFTNTAGTFSAGAATVGDNQTLTGTVNMSFANGITVLGNADIIIAGTATTGVTFGGTAINYSVRNLTITGLLTVSTSGNLTVSGTTTINGTGGFLDNNNAGIDSFNDLVTLTANAAFNATAIITLGNLIFANGITQNNIAVGAFNVGTIKINTSQLWTGPGDINIVGVLNVNGATLTNNITGTVTVGGTLTGNILVQGPNAKLSLANTTPLTITTLTTTATGNTVDYHASGAATLRAQAYYNLTISGSGNKTIPNADITVNGDLTINGGTLYNITNNRNIILGGSWINNAGTGGFAAGTGTVTFSGTVAQTLGGSAATTFNNLVINNGYGINQVVNSIIAANLSFIAGKIFTGNYIVIIPATGTVTGAGQSTGWVRGNLQKNIATGSAVSRTFEIGDVNYYSPSTILFATVTTAGNLTGKVTATDHIEVDYSGIDSSKGVNRFWTFTNSGITFTTAAATFNWVASDLDATVITANLKVALFNGTTWSLTAVASPLSTSIQATGLTAFGDFAIAERVSAYKWTGEAYSADWNTPKNWSGGLPTTAFNTIIPAGITGGRSYPVLNAGTATVSNLTIQTAATLTVSGATLQIAGTVSNSGSFNTVAGTIELNGSAPQTIPAGLFANNKVKDLIINNNVSLADVDTLTGSLTIAAGKTFATNDKLVLKSDANGTARIAALPVDGSGNATAFITGKVSIERYIPMRKAWRLLSAPVKSATSPSINAAWQEGILNASNTNPAPGYGVLIQGGSAANGFDQGLTTNASIKVFNNATGSFIALPPVPGTMRPITDYPGYFLYVRGDRSINLMQGNAAAITPTTLRITGQVNTGSQTTNVNATGYTILGNPYPSAIDFQTLTKNNVKNSFYVWDPKLAGTYGLGSYVTFSWNSSTGVYDATTSASPLNKYIPSGEAVIIESADGINPGTITVKESDKTANGSDAVYGRVPVSLNPNGLGQQVRVNLYAVNTDATTALLDGVLTTYDDHNLNIVDNNDAKKLNGGNENIGIKREDKMLAIERRKTITDTDTTFLDIYQVKIATYELRVTMNNMNRNGMTAVIKDKYSNAINNRQLDVNGTTTIDFTITADPASYVKDRFSIVFIPAKRISPSVANDGKSTGNQDAATAKSPGDSTPIHSNNLPSLVVYPNPVIGNTVNMQLNNIDKGNYTLQLYNSTGQLISVKTIAHQDKGSTENITVGEKFVTGKYELKLVGSNIKLSASLLKL